MIQRIWAMFAKEVVQLRRDRITLATMVAIPLFQIIIYGFAINTTPRHLPTAILVEDNSDVARSIVAALQHTAFFSVERVLHTEAELERAVRSENILFAVEIPAGFERALRRGDDPSVLLVADATDPVASGNALATIDGVVSNALVGDRMIGGDPAAAQPFEVIEHRRYNPAGVSAINIVPGLLGSILTMTMLVFTSLSVTREVERGTLESLLAMPLRPAEIMIGKILPYIVVGFLQGGLIAAVALTVFRVPLIGSPILLTALTVQFVATNLAIGYSFSTVARNQLQAMQLVMLFFLPSLLLSGFAFPYNGMPQWAQWLSECLPLTHFVRIVRGIMLKGSGIDDIARDAAVMTVLMLIAMFVAVSRFRKTLD